MTRSSLLWLSASPSLKWLATDLVHHLVKDRLLYLWEYEQSDDESSSIETAVSLLLDYFRQMGAQHGPMHLIGHGISGVIGLIFAQRHPEWVRSLTLLSVGAQPLTTWHSHYYVKRNLYEGEQVQTLMYMAHQLFGTSPPYSLRQLADFLKADLSRSPCPHSLFKIQPIPTQGVAVPLMVCGGEYDSITDQNTLQDWGEWLKPNDALWLCPYGRHFFHYEYPKLTGNAIQQFLARVDQSQIGLVRAPLSPLTAVSDDS